MKKICFIDRYAKYSTDLFEYIKQTSDSKELEFLFLGPKDSEVIYSKILKNTISQVWKNESYFEDISDAIKKENPEIVHFSFELKTFGSIFNAIKFPFLLKKIKKNHTKIILTLHNILVLKNENRWDIPPYNPTKLPRVIVRILLKKYMSYLCSFCDKVIVGTNLGKKALIEFYGINQEKVNIITLGVPKKESLENNTKVINEKFPDKKIILYFGVISPRKGQQTAIESFLQIYDKLDEYVLVIVGKAPKEFKEYEKYLHRLISENKLEDKIFLLGFLPENEVQNLFKNSEMALFIYEPMTSSTHALTYAMQYEIPVIVSDIEIFHEILPQEAATFVIPKNKSNLNEAILELGKNQDLRERRKKEMKNVSIKNDMKNSAEKYLSLYHELIKMDFV